MHTVQAMVYKQFLIQILDKLISNFVFAALTAAALSLSVFTPITINETRSPLANQGK
jgi:hypothetical protein